MAKQNTTTQTRPQRQGKGRRFGNILSLLLFLAALVILYLALPGLEATVLTNILRVTLILVGGMLPAIIYDSFTKERLPALFTEYKQNLRRLGYPESMPQYQEKFNEIYGRGTQAGWLWSFSSPIIVATVLALIGWLLVFFPQAESVEGLTPNPTPLAFGFLGAYVFSLGSLVRQYVVDDLQPCYYASLINRYLSVFVLSWLVTLLVPAENGGALSSPDRYLLAAFVIGLFPTTGLRVAQRLGTTILGVASDSFKESHPLSKIDGINAYHEDRLMLEGIENMQSLCSAQIVDLMLKTRYPVEQIVDWIDQTLLHLHARERILDFQKSGLRTATDFLDAYDVTGLSVDDLDRQRNNLAQLLDSQRAENVPEASCTLTQLDMIASALRFDPNLFHVRYWRDHEYEALPEDVERKRTTADLQLMQGFPQKATAAYTELLRDYPNYRTALLYRGLAYYAMGDYVHAIEDYDRLIDPERPQAESTRHAYLERGRAWRELGEYQAAIENYQKALAVYETFPEAQLDLARVQMVRLNQYKEAIEILESIESDKFKAEALANLGLARYEWWKQRGRPDEEKDRTLRQAQDDLEHALRLKPDLIEAYLNLARVLEELDKVRAPETLTEALRRLETTPDTDTAYRARLQRGNLYLERGDYQAAADDYLEATHLIPTEAAAFFNLGVARQNLGVARQNLAQFELAAYALRDATRMYPQHAPAQQARGDVALARGRPEEAETSYSSALRLTRIANDKSGQALARLSLGRLYRQADDRSPDARREFEQAIELAGEARDDLVYTQACYELGVLHLESGALDKAVTLLTTSAELFDVLDEARASVRAGLQLGRAYLAQQEQAAAAEALGEAGQKLDCVFEPQNEADAELQAEIEAELARCETDSA